VLAKYEQRLSRGEDPIWIGRYLNLHNISHWHLEHELIVCERGRASIMVNDNLFELSAGDALFCPSGDVHYINANENNILYVCLYDKVLTKGITDKLQLKTPAFQDKYKIAYKLTEIQEELVHKHRFYTFRASALITELIVDIFRNESIVERHVDKAIYLTKYKELLNWIEVNIESATFQEAAAFMNMSESYFSRWFSKISGMPFSRYLNTVRIEFAVDILLHDPSIPISSLMLECGFSTIRNFNRIFKTMTGYSPTQLPHNYTMNVRTLAAVQNRFDPTLKNSILLSADQM